MRTLAALLLCFLLLPHVARADEEREPAAQKPPPQETPPRETADAAKIRRERDAIAAGVIGRGLVSPDEAVRKKAVDRLIARLETGRDLEGFLNQMSDAIGDWANRQERLMEIWIDEAVNGTAEERERAVLLLAALGPKAVRRLALELRHRGRHTPQHEAPRRRASGEKAKEQPDAKGEPEVAPPPPTGTPEPAAGVARYYNVADLLKGSFKQFELNNLLRREADAVSVKEYATGYIVTAPEKGHDALRAYLTALRVRLDAGAGSEPAPDRDEAKDDGVKVERPAPPPAAPKDGAPNPGAQEDKPAVWNGTARKDAQGESVSKREPAASTLVAKARTTPVPLNRKALQWQITPVILHLPRGGLIEALLSAEGNQLDRRSPLRYDTDVILGSVEDAKRWSVEARKVPDARVELPWDGPNLIAMDTPAQLFAGKKIRYSKDVRQSAGGAWRIVTGTIPHGIELELRVTREAKGLRVRLSAEHCEVGLPLPVITVRPSPRAAPVELEQPQWSTTRMSTSFLLGNHGGGAFLPLTGLGTGPDDHLVLVLSVEGYRPQPQQAGPRNSARAK